MGQTQSSWDEDVKEKKGLTVQFISTSPVARGIHHQEYFHLNSISNLRIYLIKHGASMKNHNVSFVLNIGDNFIVTNTLQRLLADETVRDSWKGFYLEGLRIEGAFSGSVSQLERTQWLSNIMKLVAYSGLVLRDDVGLISEPNAASNTGWGMGMARETFGADLFFETETK